MITCKHCESQINKQIPDPVYNLNWVHCPNCDYIFAIPNTYLQEAIEKDRPFASSRTSKVHK